MSNRGYIRFLFSGSERRAYATVNSPEGILKGLLASLKFRGLSRREVESRLEGYTKTDIAALEKAFEAIDSRAFRRMLNLGRLQLVIVEGPGLEDPGMGETADQGTILGPIG